MDYLEDKNPSDILFFRQNTFCADFTEEQKIAEKVSSKLFFQFRLQFCQQEGNDYCVSDNVNTIIDQFIADYGSPNIYFTGFYVRSPFSIRMNWCPITCKIRLCVS
jgi:hypothetical protein